MRHASTLAAFLLGAALATACGAVAGSIADSSRPAETAATVTALGDAETRVAPSGKASVTILARGRNAFVARLNMDGGGKVPLHRDATEEYIHLLSGSGTITVDGVAHELGPGHTVYMPANAEVSFQGGADPLVAIQVFAGPAPAAKYDGWAPREGGLDR